jgi:hypothetical protein
MILPGPDHDPTGDTGKWDLGWRKAPSTSAGEVAAPSDWTPQPALPPNILRMDEIAIKTQLRDVSFRMENELGLLVTNTVKCVWVEIEVGV